MILALILAGLAPTGEHKARDGKTRLEGIRHGSRWRSSNRGFRALKQAGPQKAGAASLAIPRDIAGLRESPTSRARSPAGVPPRRSRGGAGRRPGPRTGAAPRRNKRPRTLGSRGRSSSGGFPLRSRAQPAGKSQRYSGAKAKSDLTCPITSWCCPAT